MVTVHKFSRQEDDWKSYFFCTIQKVYNKSYKRIVCTNVQLNFSLHKNLIEHLNEPQHDKTNKMTCVPSEDSDQPGHPPSLMRVAING